MPEILKCEKGSSTVISVSVYFLWPEPHKERKNQSSDDEIKTHRIQSFSQVILEWNSQKDPTPSRMIVQRS